MFHGPEYRFKEPGSMFQEEESVAGNFMDRRRDTYKRNEAACSRDQRGKQI
jgi:hypothetical protein